jgi:anti-sigma factor RsiW
MTIVTRTSPFARPVADCPILQRLEKELRRMERCSAVRAAIAAVLMGEMPDAELMVRLRRIGLRGDFS